MLEPADPRPGQGVLAGMPARRYSCTPTRLTTWLDCPRRYRWTYLDRPAPHRGPPWAHTGLGAAVHLALAAWWSQPLPRRTPAGGVELLRSAWPTDGFRDEPQRARARDVAVGWVRAYLAGLDPAADPVGVERTVATPTATLVVSGRVDRIDLRGDAVVVVDYKTGRRSPDRDGARSSLALALYAVAAARTLRRPAGRVELHHLPTGEVAAADHDETSLTRKVAEAESIARDALRADLAHAAGDHGDSAFPPRPSPGCSWCDFRAHCPEGRAAAPTLSSWAGLPEGIG
jgi:putative RecB family exonuclease